MTGIIGIYEDVVYSKLTLPPPPPHNLSIMLYIYPREENQLEPQLHWSRCHSHTAHCFDIYLKNSIYMEKQDTGVEVSELWKLKASTCGWRSDEIQLNCVCLINVIASFADTQVHLFLKTQVEI